MPLIGSLLIMDLCFASIDYNGGLIYHKGNEVLRILVKSANMF